MATAEPQEGGGWERRRGVSAKKTTVEGRRNGRGKKKENEKTV